MEKGNKKAFKKRLVDIGMNQTEFAKIVGVHPFSVSRWKNVPKWAFLVVDKIELDQYIMRAKEIYKGNQTDEIFEDDPSFDYEEENIEEED